jgi:hypothetical protein
LAQVSSPGKFPNLQTGQITTPVRARGQPVRSQGGREHEPRAHLGGA